MMLGGFAQKISESGCSRLLLAVSGGIDSMCMADLFHRAGFAGFSIAHCNFRLRADESDADEALVRQWAGEHDVMVHVTGFNTREYASEHGISIEMAARDLRYGWFASLCEEYGYEAVAVAHNANDNAETLILNLLRGSGMNGLSGMTERSVLPVRGSAVTLLRPLLGYTRKQIEGHVFAHQVPYRDDSTNASSMYSRNRIRNEVFPLFEKVNPSFIRTLNREMGYFTEAGQIVSDWCTREAADVMSAEGRISLPALLGKKHWKYLLYHVLEPYGFNSSVLASVEDLLSSSRTASGKRFHSGTHVLWVGRDELVVEGGKQCTRADEPVTVVRCGGAYRFGGRTLKVEVLQWQEGMPLKQPPGVLVADAAKLRFPFVARRWRKGDWMIPFGMRGRKKLSDMFADLKYDRHSKEDAIVLVDTMTEGMADQGHVAALAGIRMDDRYRIGPDTQKIIRVSLD